MSEWSHSSTVAHTRYATVTMGVQTSCTDCKMECGRRTRFAGPQGEVLGRVVYAVATQLPREAGRIGGARRRLRRAGRALRWKLQRGTGECGGRGVRRRRSRTLLFATNVCSNSLMAVGRFFGSRFKHESRKSLPSADSHSGIRGISLDDPIDEMSTTKSATQPISPTQ